MLPPRGFVPAGTVSEARRAPAGPTLAGELPRARHSRGLRYQQAVETAVSVWGASRSVSVETGPWFRFLGTGGGRWSRYDAPENSVSPSAWRWCQPDLVVDPGPNRPLLILECKLQFEPLAWWQLDRLYKPVVEAATKRQAHLGSIVGSFDPAHRPRIGADAVASFGSPVAWLDARIAASLWFGPDPSPLLPVLQWKKPSATDLSLDGW